MNNKTSNLKEKLKQALSSTARAISDDFETKDELDKNKNSKKFDLFDIENLNSKNDFIKARAEFDTAALKKNFLMKKFIKRIYHPTHLADLYIQ